MACQISSLVKQKSLVLWLISLTILYQIVYQVLMLRTLSQRAAEDECSIDLVNTPRCMELRLFRDWDRAQLVSHDLNVARHDDIDDFGEDLLVMEGEGLQEPAILEAPTTGTPAGETATNGNASKVSVAVLEDLKKSASQEMLSRSDSVSTTWSARSAFNHNLDEIQRFLEHRLESSHRSKRHEEFNAQFNRQADIIASSLARSSNMTPWSQDLAVLQEQMEVELAALPGKQATHRAGVRATTTMPYSGNRSLMSQINVLLVEMCEEPRRREREDCIKILSEQSQQRSDSRTSRHKMELEALRHQGQQFQSDLDAVAAESAAWQREFNDRVAETHKELCGDPWRRDRPDCIEFLASVAAVEHAKADALRTARRVSRAALRGNITQEGKERAAALERQLAEIATDGKAWEDELLSNYRVAQLVPKASTEASSVHSAVTTNHGTRTMHWSSVRDWENHRNLRGSDRGTVVLHRRDLRDVTWGGMIPKVSCITAFKSSFAAKVHMKYFIENFYKQSYEGPTQLIIVYHFEDRDAAELVKMHADGVHIKGVAAHSKAAVFPTTKDLRYGAYTASDADVIAHWDFNEWHDPRRLFYQVRALAVSSRPASLLTPTDHSKASTSRVAQSLVGEAGWMNKHWLPGLEAFWEALEVERNTDIVDVNMSLPMSADSWPAESGMKLWQADTSLPPLVQGS